jgi:hypothetical protein
LEKTLNMKLHRYHVEIYCPEWARDSILEFCKLLAENKLKYSYHANNKLKGMKKEYKLAIKNLVKNLDLGDELYLDYVFEFYANNQNIVKKVCYRFPMRDLEFDVILIISSTGKIVTIYLNGNFDKHRTLNIDNYEKEIKIESQLIIKN